MKLARLTGRLAKGAASVAASSAALFALVVGVPYLLITFVGNPIPNSIPVWDEIVLSVQSRQVDDSLIVQVLALVVWVAWAQLLLSLVVEVRAAVVGARASAVRGLGATQWLARRLVAQFTLASTLFVQGTIGLALPAAPALADVVPTELVLPSENGYELSANAEQVGFVVAVQRSDTLWDLAQLHLGDGSRWTEIRDANVGRQMPDGTVLPDDFLAITGDWSLLIPVEQTTSAGTPVDGADSVIGAWRVEPGDHFWMMAERVLQAGWGRIPTEAEVRSYWLDIIGHNRDNLVSPGNDPNVIYAEQSFEILVPPLPADQAGIELTQTASVVESLEGIRQFEPVSRPPLMQRPTPVGPDLGSPTGANQPDSEDAAGPVVEIVPEATESADGLTPLPADEPLPLDGEPAPGSEGDGDSVSMPDLDGRTVAAAGLGVGAVAAALLLRSLRSRRRYQASRRRPGSIPDLPGESHREFETKVRSIADHESLRWLAATNKYLSHSLEAEDAWRLPAIVAMRAGEHGVEVLLDNEVDPPRGFVAAQQPRAWILDPDIEVRQIEQESQASQPFAPLLLPAGGTGGGDLLFDLGQFGTAGLVGPDEAIVGWLRSLTVAITTAPWAGEVGVVAIGVDPILDRMDHVVVPADPVAWAQETVVRHKADGAQPTSPYEQRLRGEPVSETLVLVGPGHEGVAQHLMEVAELVNAPLTLLAAAPVAGEARIEFEGTRATLEPAGITFWPSVMTAEAIAMTTTLLDQAADTGSVPVDVNYADEVPWVGVASQDEGPSGEGVGECSQPDLEAFQEWNPAESLDTKTVEEPELFPPDEIELAAAGADEPLPEALGESAAIAEQIDGVLRAMPVEVSILTPVPTVEGTLDRLTPKNVSVLAYLAFHRSVTANAVRSVFWASSTSRSTSDNAISLIRRVVGKAEDGTPRLNLASEGRFTVSDEIGCDWTRFQQLVGMAEAAKGDGHVGDEVASLRAALGLVQGSIATDAEFKNWLWLRDDPMVYSLVETSIVDAAHRLGYLGCEQGMPELARWAADKGLLVVPEQEALYRIQMSAASLAGDEGTLQTVFRLAQRSAEPFGDGVQPETELLYRRLVGYEGNRDADGRAETR